MKYIVYQTINKINKKIYIGVHSTENPDVFDHYLGNGSYDNKPSSYNKAETHFHQALMKYGVSNFYRKTLKVFDTLDEAKKFESIIVDEAFIRRTDTYNMTLGGGIPPILNKIVYQFDLQGNLIKKWESVKSVIEYYKCNEARIRMCVSGKRSFDNCYWNYENKINVSEYRLSSRGYVFLYNFKGEYLNFFENATVASSKLNIDRNTIVNAVFAKHLCHGYYFLKADENIEDVLNFKNNRKNLKNTKVFRYTLDGKFDKEYSSMKEAELDSKCKHSNIIRAIKNNKTSGGYKWSYIKSDVIQPFLEQKLTPVKIAQYDKEHNLIKIWDSLAECQKEFPYCRKVCRKEKKSTAGYIFEYIS